MPKQTQTTGKRRHCFGKIPFNCAICPMSSNWVHREFDQPVLQIVGPWCKFLPNRKLSSRKALGVILQKTSSVEQLQALKGEYTIQDDFMSSCLSQTPIDSVLRKVFLSHFLLNENVYLQEMAKVPVTPFVSFDHTFRVAANIGYLRKDGKWVPQYDSMFIVMNEVGEIVTWQLTKGTSFGEVNQLLEDLKSHPNSNIIKTVYIDDCCKLRKRIETVFGENVAVKLDLFHATQRISKTLNKRSPLFAKCIQDLRLVFRTTGDYGVHREHCTPESQVMEKNVDDFVQKWTGAVDSSGYSVFTSNTVHETTKLKKHIRKGCLF